MNELNRAPLAELDNTFYLLNLSLWRVSREQTKFWLKAEHGYCKFYLLPTRALHTLGELAITEWLGNLGVRH
jgi:hypothetical protein